MSNRWAKAHDLGLFAGSGAPAPLGLPAWAIEQEYTAVPYRYPPRVDQHLFDREIFAIIASGHGTMLDMLRTQRRGGPISPDLRETFRHELYAADPHCYWCRQVMDIEVRVKITPSGREKTNDRFASFEHLIPRSLGGRFTRDNITLAHAGCNRKRHDKNKATLPRYAHDPLRQPGACA